MFDFKKELEEYSSSDVDILRKSMIKFREDFIELENIDPLQYITNASVGMAIYRSNYMPGETIGVVNSRVKLGTVLPQNVKKLLNVAGHVMRTIQEQWAIVREVFLK